MEPGTVNLGQLAATSKRFARRLLTIGENRLALLMVEVQEERVRLLRAILLALGVAALGLLAGSRSPAWSWLFWDFSPSQCFGVDRSLWAAAVSYRRLTVLCATGRIFPHARSTRKDRACLEKLE